MLYKEDTDKAKERMKAWFAGEMLDRAIIQVTAPKNGYRPQNAWSGWYLVHNSDNPKNVAQECDKWCQGLYWGGEAFPHMSINFGPGSVAGYLGCDYEVARDTVWYEANEPWSWDRILSLKIDPENEWWRKTLRATQSGAAQGEGKFIVQVPDLGATMNILASMRGNQQLLLDCLNNPEEVKQAANLVNEHVLTYYNQCADITQTYMEGSMSWMGIWFPGRGSDVQCDFSAMLSPKMFKEFVAPHLQEHCRRYDQTIYHWDGPGQIPHLDLLLDIPELDGIQWVPGSGAEGSASPKWYPLYKRIQEAGKLLVLQWLTPADVESLMEVLSPKGVLFSTGCGSEEEANALIKKVEKWSCRR